MNTDQLRPNVIIRGAIFPEPVKIITIIPMGDSVKLIGEGMDSGKVHQPILTKEQIERLEIASAEKPYDGDPHKFRLGVEAMRLELAHEHDPYFSLSVARVGLPPINWKRFMIIF